MPFVPSQRTYACARGECRADYSGEPSTQEAHGDPRYLGGHSHLEGSVFPKAEHGAVLLPPERAKVAQSHHDPWIAQGHSSLLPGSDCDASLRDVFESKSSWLTCVAFGTTPRCQKHLQRRRSDQQAIHLFGTERSLLSHYHACLMESRERALKSRTGPTMEEGKKMRTLLIILAALALMLVSVTPAFGAIHDIASSECAADSGSDVANDQDPPGQIDQGAPGINNSVGNSNGKSLNGNSGAGHCPNA